MEIHFEQFWGLLAKWLCGRPWELILSSSGACSPHGFQESAGSLFSAILAPARQITLRSRLELIASVSGLSSPNGSQEVSGGSFRAFLGSAGEMASIGKH